MCSLAARRRGSSPHRLGSNRLSSRCGSSRLLSRRGLSPNRNSSRAPSSAAAEIREGRAPRVPLPLHGARRRVLSSKLRNAKAGRLSSHAKVGQEVVRSAKSVR